MTDLQPAIISFASLPVQEKVRKIGSAVIEAEKSLEGGNRRIGHPADWPLDYLDLVGIKLLGASQSGYDKNAAQCAGYSGTSVSLFKDRTSSSLPDDETLGPGGTTLVIVSAAPENQFVGLINGSALLGQNQRLERDWLLKSALPTIDGCIPLARTLFEQKIYKRVFVGSFAFVDTAFCDWEKTDRAFSAFAHRKQQFQYEGVDIAICVAGLELSA